jgi:hypothetical protein
MKIVHLYKEINMMTYENIELRYGTCHIELLDGNPVIIWIK